MCYLTGIKDLDFKILCNLNDYELYNVCLISKYFKDLLDNEIFWMNRVINRYGKYLGTSDQIGENLYIDSWKNYYLTIKLEIDTFDNPDYDQLLGYKRIDISNIYRAWEENTEKIFKNIEEYDLQNIINILDTELVDCSELFHFAHGDILKYLLERSKYDPRLKPDEDSLYQNFDMMRDEDNVYLFMEYGINPIGIINICKMNSKLLIHILDHESVTYGQIKRVLSQTLFERDIEKFKYILKHPKACLDKNLYGDLIDKGIKCLDPSLEKLSLILDMLILVDEKQRNNR